jgi:hypothetical protein
MDMISVDRSGIDHQFKALRDLPQQLSAALTDFALQYLIPIFRHPHEVVFAIPHRVATSLVVFHLYKSRPHLSPKGEGFTDHLSGTLNLARPVHKEVVSLFYQGEMRHAIGDKCKHRVVHDNDDISKIAVQRFSKIIENGTEYFLSEGVVEVKNHILVWKLEIYNIDVHAFHIVRAGSWIPPEVHHCLIVYLFPQLNANYLFERRSRRDQKHSAFAAAHINEAIVAEIIERKRIQFPSRCPWTDGKIRKIVGICVPTPSELLGQRWSGVRSMTQIK